ncbi:MAG: hypothetical protein NW224_05505 [Leptolyngbyaceae cyanobacterium bins.302]|nr:hypothetical protein [Leptolyngbyaceae cyanobacterium bins.302]
MTVANPSPPDTVGLKPRFLDRWIVSPRYDLCFFIGSCSLTFAFWGLYRLTQQTYSWHLDSILLTYFVFTAFFDHPHIFQTFSRTHFDAIEFKQRRLIHTWGLLGLIMLGFVVIGLGREAELIVFASVLGSYHIIRQHYGLLKAYKNLNRDRQRIDDWLDFGLFHTGMYACFFYDYTDIENPIVIYGSLQSAFPDLPPIVGDVTWHLFQICLVLFIVRQFQRLWQGRSLNLPKLLFLAAVLSTHYFIFFATATPFLVAEALETAYHNVQYQGWIVHYQNQRFAGMKHIALKWFAVAMLYGLGVGAIELFGLLDQGWGLWLFVPFTMVVIYHYLVDGLIWKFSRQPELHCVFAQRSHSTSPNPR